MQARAAKRLIAIARKIIIIIVIHHDFQAKLEIIPRFFDRLPLHFI